MTQQFSNFSIQLIGTGTSVGVPVIGCDCAVCQSEDPRNARMRSSAVLRAGDLTLLIDSGPDLRQQALAYDLKAIDGVLYTHGHVDHVAGFDEMRAFCWRRDSPLPLYLTSACLDTLTSMFGWAFSADNIYPGYIKPDPHLIDGPFHIGELKITPLPVTHGQVQTIGFRFDYPDKESIAYIPDVKEIHPQSYEALLGCDILIVDSLRDTPLHPTHMCLEESLSAAKRVGARQTYFTHVSHEIDFSSASAKLPDKISYAYDGIIICADNKLITSPASH